MRAWLGSAIRRSRLPSRISARNRTQDGDDADLTANYSVGTATSDGQRFRVLRPHARGGLGAVFVALDGELHREVALKQILDHHADDPVSRQRFLLEAEVTGGLEHPGIVPVYGLGTYGDGRPYYAMRLVRGDSLKEAIEQFHGDAALKNDPGRRSLELRKLLRRFLDVCNAIDYAHGRGVLHRDIKPANIIVGKYGETLVVDWGLAKATGRSDPEAGERTLMPSSASGSMETLPGSAMGTPAYMSPEQAAGELDRLGPASDVYCLGATLYCLLTGKAAVRRGRHRRLAARRAAGRLPAAAPARPADRQGPRDGLLESDGPEAPDRYPSAKALADDVERWLADEAVTAWREPWTVRARRWLARNRSLVGAVAIAAPVAIVSLSTIVAHERLTNGQLAANNRELAAANQIADPLPQSGRGTRGHGLEGDRQLSRRRRIEPGPLDPVRPQAAPPAPAGRATGLLSPVQGGPGSREERTLAACGARRQVDARQLRPGLAQRRVRDAGRRAEVLPGGR